MLSKSEIIGQTNDITFEIYNNAKKGATSLTTQQAHELRVAAIHAASRVMQAKILANVIDSKRFG